MIINVGKLEGNDVNVVRVLLNSLAEADHLMPGSALSAVLSGAGRAAGSAEQIAVRAAELEGPIFDQLWKERRAVFRGRDQRATLDSELRAEARARAYTKAQRELRGEPLALAAGAPARTTVNAAVDIPFGFYDRAGFEQFGHTVHAALPASARDAELAIEGSGALGRRFDRLVDQAPTGAPFNVGRVSDYDIAIVSDHLLEAAREARIAVLKEIPPHTGVLTGRQLARLNLSDLDTAAHEAVRAATGIPHKVHFQIVGSGTTNTIRLPIPR
jgi:hypothetical protein